MDPNHVFRIGSITKTFTAAAILKLAANKQLSLADDIRQYLPEFLPGGPKITIEHLLSHTAGIKTYNRIPNWEDQINQTDQSPEAIINIFKEEPLLFTPGEQFLYSNLGYILLGKIIEVVATTSYENYLQSTFFEPLGMKHTYYDQNRMVMPHQIEGYSKDKDHFHPADYLDMKIPFSAGGLRSNVDDIYLWYQALYNGQVLPKSILNKAHTPFVLNNGMKIPYGLGWKAGNIKGVRSIKHDGVIQGFTSFALYLPEKELFVALFSNCDCNLDIEAPASKLAAIAIGDPFQNSANPIIPKATLLSLQGVYESENGAKKQITYQDGQLMYHDKGGGKTPLLPAGNQQFHLGDEYRYLDFTVQATGEIKGFTMYTLDFLQVGKKFLMTPKN